MALSISCCLNLPPSSSTPTSETIHSKISHLAWPQNKMERSWKSRCLLGVASIIIGLEMSNLVVGEQEIALASDLQQQREQGMASKSVIKVPRWSDKRICPPWRVNSLETIVPENLPRPSFPRRWENADFPTAESSQAPQLAAKVVFGPKICFSL